MASQFSSLYTSYDILHCKEIRIHEFPEKELRCLSPYFHIHGVSERSIYSYVRPTYFHAAKIGRPIRGVCKSLTKHECRNWDSSRAIPLLGILVSNFRYCAFAVCLMFIIIMKFPEFFLLSMLFYLSLCSLHIFFTFIRFVKEIAIISLANFMLLRLNYADTLRFFTSFKKNLFL